MSATGPVLIVDDDEDIREALGEVLADLGYAVVKARNGREALSLVRGLPQPPQLILLDLMMPVMNGWQFLEAHGTDHEVASIPVVVMTAARQSAVDAPAVKAVLRKPIAYDDLVGVVRAHVR
ncbi:MAG: response regulator [Archangiaceae bacterium]|nr:response regulator [Archangiaceae bacterium]